MSSLSFLSTFRCLVQYFRFHKMRTQLSSDAGIGDPRLCKYFRVLAASLPVFEGHPLAPLFLIASLQIGRGSCTPR